VPTLPVLSGGVPGARVSEATTQAFATAQAAAGRLARLRVLLASQRLEAVVVCRPADVRYLTGFGGVLGLALVTETRALLVVAPSERTQAAQECATSGFEVVDSDGSPWAVVRERVTALGVRRLGVQGEALTLAEAEILGDGLRAERVLAPPLVARLRAVKEPGEIVLLERAAAVALAAFARAERAFAPGRRERDAARALAVAILRQGADGLAFDPIVGSGPRSALPHARPGDRRIARNEAVIVDFGAAVGGYRSDVARTLVRGRLPAPLAQARTAVLEALAAATAALKPGRRGDEVDAAARRAFARAGLDGLTGHAIGHGIGLEVHERPLLARGSRDVLQAGMVVTVEPGVYLPGVGGVRIEEMLVVTENGARALTAFDATAARTAAEGADRA
jgi:Xaa-Pro aminopeptidase